MAWDEDQRHLVKTEPLKTKVTLEIKERAKEAAKEDGLMLETWVRDAIEHVLTMREVDKRIKAYESNQSIAS